VATSLGLMDDRGRIGALAHAALHVGVVRNGMELPPHDEVPETRTPEDVAAAA
jgi:hypothetical protein